MAMFLEAVKGLFGSKKFLTTLTGIIAVLVAKIGWNLDEEIIWQIVCLVSACVTGQGLADLGKYKATT